MAYPIYQSAKGAKRGINDHILKVNKKNFYAANIFLTSKAHNTFYF